MKCFLPANLLTVLVDVLISLFAIGVKSHVSIKLFRLFRLLRKRRGYIYNLGVYLSQDMVLYMVPKLSRPTECRDNPQHHVDSKFQDK